MKSILIEEAYRAIKVRDGSREVTIPMIRAVVRSMALAAVKGQARSQRMFTALLQATEKERKAEHDLTLETAIEYKTQWEDKLERLAPANLCSSNQRSVRLYGGCCLTRSGTKRNRQ